MSRDEGELSLLCRVDRRLLALPLTQVIETMRPLPVEPVAGAPDFVLGIAIVRGEPVPVVDAAALLGSGGSRPGRLVTLRIDGRQVALAVEAVLGVRSIAVASLGDLPPLVRAARGDAISEMGTLDAELLLVLGRAHMVPDSVWDAVEAEQGTP